MRRTQKALQNEDFRGGGEEVLQIYRLIFSLLRLALKPKEHTTRVKSSLVSSDYKMEIYLPSSSG